MSVARDSSANRSEARIRDLKYKRRPFKTQLTLFNNYLSSFEDNDIERIKLRERIQRMREQFVMYNEIQNELGIIDNYDEAETERQATTENFDLALAKAIFIIEKPVRTATPASEATSHDAIGSASPHALPVNLPKIDLPKFDGRTENWITFKDAFNTLIHQQPGLSKIQKLQYLRLSLSGKAEAAIGAFTISEGDYEAAWKHLIEMYDNKRALVLRHAALLRDTPAMPDDSSESIRDLVNYMQLHVRSLQALGRSGGKLENDFLVSVATSKMTRETRKAWERTLSDTEVPDIADVFKFLNNASHQSKEYDSTSPTRSPNEGRYAKSRNVPSRSPNEGNSPTTRTVPSRSCNCPPRTRPTATRNTRNYTYVTNATPTNRNSPPSSPSGSRRKPKLRSPPSPRSRRRNSNSSNSPCTVCNANHQLFQCEKFLELPVTRRVEAARKENLCLNCLLPGHNSDNCRAGKCRVCKKPHNTKLHQDAKPPPNTSS